MHKMGLRKDKDFSTKIYTHAAAATVFLCTNHKFAVECEKKTSSKENKTKDLEVLLLQNTKISLYI